MAMGPKTDSEAAAGVKRAATALAGYPGIFQQLSGEHMEVSTLMSRVAGTFDHSEAREELFREIRTDLLAHARGEEQVFYSRLREFPELESIVSRCLEEHQEIEDYLDRLESMDKSAEGWTDLFQQLKGAVESHVTREENQLFPKAKDLLDREQAEDMQARYQEIEKQQKSRL